MTFLCYDRQDFYKRMLDLQEKVRKSEEERIRLEERFKLLVQESENRHDACINRLRLRYIEFLEEQRDREDRNNKLQGALDKVDSHLALMTAKSDRLSALRKHYEAYLLQVYGNPRSCGSVTGDSGVTSHHEDRSFRKELIAQSRRHSIQSVSIPPSTPTTNFPSRVVTPTLPKFSELRFVDPPRTHQANFSYSHQQPLYSTPKISYKQPQVFSSFTPQIPEIRISPSFSPTFVSRDVQTDKPINSFFDQSFTSVEPYQISGIGRISQVSSTQTLPQFSNQFSHQVTHSPPIHNISQYLYTPSLPKTNNFLERSPESRTEYRGFSGLENSPSVFKNTLPTPSYPDYSWRYARNSRFEEKSPRFDNNVFEKNSIFENNVFEKNSIFDKNPIFERNSIFDKNSTFERNSRFEDKSPPRFFRRFDFNTTFRRNDRPLPSSKDLLSSSRTKPSVKPFKLSTSLRSDYDVYERSRKMDNELDRYIGKIRNLHRDVDLQSLEDLDHEQNTSGDLLNVTLSDDDLDLPVEEKTRESRSRGERVQALAKKGDQSEVSGKQVETLRVPNAADPATQTDAPVSETRCDVPTNKEDETSAVIAADEISSKITKRGAEIAANENINSEFPKSVENSIDRLLDEKERNRVVFDESKVSVFGELISGSDDLPETDEKYKLGEEKEIAFNGLKEFKENNPDSGDQKMEAENQKTNPEDQKTNPEYQKIGTKDLKIDAEEKKIDAEDEKIEGPKTECENKKEMKELEESQEAEVEKKIENQQGEEEKLTEDQDFVQDPNQDYQYGSNQDYNYDPNAGYDQYQAYPPEGYEQYNQEYDPNQQYSQDPSQYAQDANQYNEDPNQYSQDPSPYTQDPNQQYDSNQQYEQGSNQQYDPSQYNQDPNQYNQDPNQYSLDANQQIEQDPSQQYVQDPSQEYAQDPNQYDPSQPYQDPNVQYDPTQPYDPNQAYDYSQSQEYSQQDQSYVQQDQNYNSDQPYDQNFPPETVVEKDSQKEVVQAQEKESDGVEINIKKKDVINLESDTESTIERNASNTESDFDFN